MPEQILIPPTDLNVVLQLLIVFGWAVALLIIDLFVAEDNKRLTGYLAIAGLVVASLAGVPLWNYNRSTFSEMIALNNYALVFNWIFLLIAVITIAISLDYLPRHGIERGEYYPLVLFATGGMMLLGQGSDLIVLFLGLELLSITLYILAGFAYPRVSSEEAAMKYLLIGGFASGFLVFGIALLYGATGASNLMAINAANVPAMPMEMRLYLMAGAALVVVGFGYKIAMAPFHMWTPDVYEGAPTPVTAFMSVGTKAAGFAALLGFLTRAIPGEWAIWVPVLGALAATTMILGNLAAVAQRNVKRMLAYSSIAHAGYILLAVLAAGSPDAAARTRGVESFLFYLVAYALTNLGAFAVLIALEQRGEAAWSLDDLAGLWNRRPWMAVAMAVCMLSLAGVPPTAGFVGKFYVFTATWQAGLEVLALIGVIVSIVAAFFYLRVVVQMFMREPVREVPVTLNGGLNLGLGLATLGVLVFGIIPTPLLELVQRSVMTLGR